MGFMAKPPGQLTMQCTVVCSAVVHAPVHTSNSGTSWQPPTWQTLQFQRLLKCTSLAVAIATEEMWGSAGGNSFSGTLPPSWAGPDSFEGLLHLNLSQNNLTGPLPASWSMGFYNSTAFEPDIWLTNNDSFLFDLHGNFLTGTIPAAWSQSGKPA